MKYIKKYENMSSTNVYYWKIPAKYPNVEIALEKLKNEFWCKLTMKNINHMYENLDELEYIYILKNEYVDYGFIYREWATESTLAEIKDRFKNANIENMGKITITKKDIKQFYFNQNVNKYNI